MAGDPIGTAGSAAPIDGLIDMSPTGLRPDLVFFNARVITVSDRRPTATLVAVRRDRIVWVGDDGDVPEPSWGNARAIDCEGQTLVPGFIDAHCHLLAYAASLLAVDCGPSAVASIRDIEQALRRRSLDVPEGQWIRASGYDEFHLEERRHPSRRDLDEAAPNHPVRLDHRSGHACVLNSAGLARAGISMDTPEPAGGTIERDWETGEPNGLLIEMNDHLEGLTAPLGESELRRGVELAGRRLLSLGVTSVQDATHTNSPESWEVLKRLKAGGSLAPRLTMMAGSDYLDHFVERGLRFGSGDAALDLGAAKIMLTMTDGTLRPSPAELLERVQRASRRQLPGRHPRRRGRGSRGGGGRPVTGEVSDARVSC